jgi:hypothetical protein
LGGLHLVVDSTGVKILGEVSMDTPLVQHLAHSTNKVPFFMLSRPELIEKVSPFLARFDQSRSDGIWSDQSAMFRTFWRERVMSEPTGQPISDHDCDQVIRILDRSGKGNKSASESVARAMVPQGAWRRMFNQLHTDRPLGTAVNRALTADTTMAKAAAIDEVYELNAPHRNNMTGASGNAIGALIAAHDPRANLSMISLKHRKMIIDYLGLEVTFDWSEASVGEKLAKTNEIIMKAAAALELPASARTVTKFFYDDAVMPVWRVTNGEDHRVSLPDREVSVVVPTVAEDEDEQTSTGDELQAPDTSDGTLRESFQIQALLAHIGSEMGFHIWLPRTDRSRVLKAWTPPPGRLLDRLPLGFDPTTIATIEQIDVLWLNQRSVVRAFEVEHTTSIYSGLLRMADLVALQPNLKVKLHIVASVDRRKKVLREIQRPVFSLLQGSALRDLCTYLSYDTVREIADFPHLTHISDSVIGEYEEEAAGTDDVI